MRMQKVGGGSRKHPVQAALRLAQAFCATASGPHMLFEPGWPCRFLAHEGQRGLPLGPPRSPQPPRRSRQTNTELIISWSIHISHAASVAQAFLLLMQTRVAQASLEIMQGRVAQANGLLARTSGLGGPYFHVPLQ